MTFHDIAIPRDAIAAICRRHRIHRLSLFGSILRDDFRSDSDIDVLVEFEPGATPGFGFIGIQDELTAALGRPVDLHTPASLSRYFRDDVLREAEPLYDAHDDSVPLRHMRDHAAEAIALARGRTRADLETDRLFALGLTKLVEIIGEAAGRVSDSTCNAHPNIPWGHIISTRNRLVHGYDQVDYNILWQIVSVELRPLIDLLDGILKNSGGKEP